MALLVTIICNILKYIDESLYWQMQVHLYKRTLGQLNIIYIVKDITKQKGLKKLDVLVLQIREILNILKTMIFVDNIDDELKIVQYL